MVRYQQPLWLERKTAERGGVLCQDTYFVGTIKGVGKITGEEQ